MNKISTRFFDEKMRLTDTLGDKGIVTFAKHFPGKKVNRFIEWITYSRHAIIDGKNTTKAYALFESGMLK